jgi:hypothetical protein
VAATVGHWTVHHLDPDVLRYVKLLNPKPEYKEKWQLS